MLEAQGLNTYYGGAHILHDVSLRLGEHEVVALLGRNGAGKSTTIKTIIGLVRPRRGTIRYDGAEIQGLAPHRVCRLGIGYVPEERRIFTRLTVQENLEMGAFTRTDRAGIKQDLERTFSLFPRLKERRNQVGGTLSGGEQQMLATARALMSRPRLLLLDEPSMGLAPILVVAIFDTVREINSQGTTILLVEQNAQIALQIAHRGYVLETGEVALSDSAESLRQNEMVQKVYLGIT